MSLLRAKTDLAIIKESMDDKSYSIEARAVVGVQHLCEIIEELIGELEKERD